MAAMTIRAAVLRSSATALAKELGGRAQMRSQSHASGRAGRLLLGGLGKHNRTSHCARSTQTSMEEEEEVLLRDTEEKAVLAEMTEFIRRDSENLFNDKGIDKSNYESKVDFQDPLTRYSSLEGYLFNIQMLKLLFRPKFTLHMAEPSPTKPWTVTTRWTMEMPFQLTPLGPIWRPVLLFTGTSEYGIDPTTKKICSHVDYWDAIDDNSFLSPSAVRELVSQMTFLGSAPKLESPKYTVLKRLGGYVEIRSYEQFSVVETSMASQSTSTANDSSSLASGTGFGDLFQYISGQNQASQKMEMTTPVFTKRDASSGDSVMQFVIESKVGAPPPPTSDRVRTKTEEPIVLASLTFTGSAAPEQVKNKETELRRRLAERNVKVKSDGECILARYNEPYILPPWRRNEVLIPVESFDFSLSV